MEWDARLIDEPGTAETPVEVGLVGAGPWAARMHGPVLAAGPQTRRTSSSIATGSAFTSRVEPSG